MMKRHAKNLGLKPSAPTFSETRNHVTRTSLHEFAGGFMAAAPATDEYNDISNGGIWI